MKLVEKKPSNDLSLSIEADEILKIDGGGNFFGLVDDISKDLIELEADP